MNELGPNHQNFDISQKRQKIIYFSICDELEWIDRFFLYEISTKILLALNLKSRKTILQSYRCNL